MTKPESLLPMPVLVVEDEPLIQARLRRILYSLGYQEDAIVIVGTLREARDHVCEHPVSMALVDLGLPDGSGIDLITELRNADASVSILVISAWRTEDIILAALQAGATGYVLKEREDLEISFSIRSVLRGGAPIDPFIARRILALLPQQQTTVSQDDNEATTQPGPDAGARAGARLEAEARAGVRSGSKGQGTRERGATLVSANENAKTTATETKASDAKTTDKITEKATQFNSDPASALSARETQILHLVAEGLTNREIAEQLFISRHTAECHIKRIYKKLAVSSRTRAVNQARQQGLLS